MLILPRVTGESMRERRRAMAKRIFSSTAVCGVAVAAVLLICAHSSFAQTVASDRTAGLVIFPKIRADADDIFGQSRRVDTLIQLTNTSSTNCRTVHCYYVDATSHCSIDTNSADPGIGACRDNRDCDLGGTCLADWQANNFTFSLSPNQPAGWRASVGGVVEPSSCSAQRQPIPAVREHYFVGELKCFEVDNADPTTVTPINANDLKAEATIYEVESGPGGFVDTRTYNAIGIPSRLADGSTQNDKVLCLGTTNGSTECAPGAAGQPEYASCPNILVLDHWFDGALVDSTANDGGAVSATTDLTLVPCSENFEEGAQQQTTTAQFIVYNEFEQRFSASTRVSCFRETALSSIDSPNQPRASIFNVAVQGTLTGQTRIRPVLGPETDVGHGLLGVAEEFNHVDGIVRGSAAFDLNFIGTNQTAGNEKGDFIRVGP
jgi:hypothetical protein